MIFCSRVPHLRFVNVPILCKAESVINGGPGTTELVHFLSPSRARWGYSTLYMSILDLEGVLFVELLLVQRPAVLVNERRQLVVQFYVMEVSGLDA